MATLDGLARFDGVRFTVFNKGNTPGITSNRFISLYEGSDGELWIGTENGDVTRYHGGAFTTYTTQHGLSKTPVWGITGDGEGGMYLLSGRQATQQAFSRQLIASQEAERQRIAAELHDGLNQSLVIIKNRATLSLSDTGNSARAIEQLEEIADAATHALDESKEIAYNLRPFQLDRLGLTQAIESMLKNVSDANDINIVAEIETIDGLIPKESEINFYRVVQESLNNIVKHARATEARVTVRIERSAITLTITDNGVGFTVGAINTSARRGFGLIGLEERAKILGGALSQIKALLPNIAVLDINMPGADGLSLAQTITDEGLPVGVILLTAHREEDLFNRALEAGVKGYVLKDSAIKAVANGQYYTSPAMSGYLIKRRSAKPPAGKPGIKDLTPTERRILKLLADYKTSREIAEELFISHRTVQTHRTNICQKLGLQGNHALMKFALEYLSELE